MKADKVRESFFGSSFEVRIDNHSDSQENDSRPLIGSRETE